MSAKVDESKCNACGACVRVCPVEAIVLKDVAVVDPEKCVDCGTCIDECPNKAISLE
jgi:ferredoxin